MKRIQFSIAINAPKNHVWNTLLQPETYKEWVKVSWPNSTYEGEWKKGEKIRFTSPGYGGTAAIIKELIPLEYVLAEHYASVNPDNTLDTTSEDAISWIGSTESYRITEKNGISTLQVEINCNPTWQDMFQKGFPAALARLKELAEA